jgi:hypothetical protein
MVIKMKWYQYYVNNECNNINGENVAMAMTSISINGISLWRKYQNINMSIIMKNNNENNDNTISIM